MAAADARPPTKFTCLWSLAHFFASSRAMPGQFVNMPVGFSTGPIGDPTPSVLDTIPNWHMCVSTFVTSEYASIFVMHSSFQLPASHGCSCKK